ncbi:MAG: hypothetical protein K5905_30610, partial [Roseibium sp.]|uniref:hypothetical protein n=1 Tax=Roseibium sp. TaxID=1936156 RepID=UPI00261CC499
LLRYEGRGDPATVRFVLVDQDGNTIILGNGPELEWDTRTIPNGIYTLQVERPSSSTGTTPAQGGYVAIDDTSFVVRNPDTSAGKATAAAAVGAGAALGATFGMQALAAMGQAGQEAAMGLGEDVLKGKTAGRSQRLKRWSDRLPSKAAVAIILGLMAAFFTFEGVDGWDPSGYVAALPIVGAAAVVFTIIELSMESFLARVSGASVRVRLLASGIVSLIATSLFLRVAVGYPGYVDEDDTDHGKELPAFHGAARAGAVLGGIIGTMAMFILIGMVNFDFMAVGTEMAVAALVANALPLKPLPGHDVWVWNKTVSTLSFLGCVGLFVLVQSAILSLPATFAVALAGIAAYLGTVVLLKRQAASQEPVVAEA